MTTRRGGHLLLAHKNDKKPANHNFSAFRAKYRQKNIQQFFSRKGAPIWQTGKRDLIDHSFDVQVG